VEFMLIEILGEDFNNLFIERIVLQVDDPIMNQLSDVLHVDFDVFFFSITALDLCKISLFSNYRTR